MNFYAVLLAARQNLGACRVCEPSRVSVAIEAYARESVIEFLGMRAI